MIISINVSQDSFSFQIDGIDVSEHVAGFDIFCGNNELPRVVITLLPDHLEFTGEVTEAFKEVKRLEGVKDDG